MLRVQLFPSLKLKRDDREIDAPASRRARELLAWLALNKGRHARASVAPRFWPDVLDASARASLRTTLHELRRALGEEGSCLAADREFVALEGDGCWVDARAFEQKIADGQLMEALELAGDGEMLSDLDVGWAYEARDLHRERLVELNERLARRAEETNDAEEATRRTREQVRLDPLSEGSARRLMRRLADAGDRPAALTAYGRLENRLRRGLQVAPSSETQELARSLRAGGGDGRRGEEDRGPQLPLPAALRRPERSEFVGRKALLARLMAMLEAAMAGQRRTLLVAGEPGVGKTRILAELCRRAHGQDATVMWGRCYEDALTPYQPFVEAITEYAAAGGGLPAGPVTQELARLVPVLGGKPETATDELEGARYRLFEAVRILIATASRGRLAVLAIDDLHWADKATLLLLAHLVRSAEPRGLLVLCSYRESELSRPHPLTEVLADLRGERVFERIVLGGLEQDEVSELVAALGARQAPVELTRALHEETRGNPFFVEELVQHLAESGAMPSGESESGEWSPIAELGIPEGVKEVLGRRLSRLSEECNHLLAGASVVGREFDLSLLGRLPEMSDADPLEAVEEAVRAQLVREDPGRPGRYGFVHPLVRETLYDELSPGRRMRLHHALARALEDEYPGDLEPHLYELATHELAAAAGGDAGRATDVTLRAARRCLAQLAYEEGALICSQALEVLGDADPQRRAKLMLMLGEARLRLGDPSSRDAFAAAASEARRLGDAELLAQAALGHSGLGVTIIAVDEEKVALLEEALAAGEGGGPLRARLLARLAIETYYASTPEQRKASGDEAVASARRAGQERALLEALNARRVALWSPAYLEERLETTAEMIDVAEREGDVEGVLQGRNWRVADLAELGDLDAMRSEIDAHEELANRLRLPSYQWWAPMWRGMLATSEGRFTDAERLIDQFAELGRRTLDANAELHLEIQRWSLNLNSERYDEIGDETLVREIGRPAEYVWRTSYAWLYAAQGSLRASQDRTNEAKGHLAWLATDDFAALPDDMNRLSSLAELSQTLVLLGDAEHAAAIYDRLLPYADRNIVYGRAGGTYGCAARYLGELAVLLGRSDLASAHLEEALARNSAINARPELARTRFAYGSLLLSQGEEDRGRELLARAAADAEEMGIEPLAERARSVA
jgi:DNA-binding SARP family transcriptional activator/DNA polymerase III delta prime subunit